MNLKTSEVDPAPLDWKRNVALFLAGQALTLFGTMIVQHAIVWHITLKTQSGAMMTLFTVAGFLPMFFISPFAGVWADRFNRKYIINLADGAVAIASLVIAIFIMAGVDSIGILFVCAIVRSFGQGVQMPAVSAFVPDIVPQEKLMKVNGFQGSILSTITLAAPAVSGALMAFTPLETLFFLDVVTAAIGISIVFFLVKVPQKKKKAAETSSEPPESESAGAGYFRDLKAGLRYMRHHGYVLRTIILESVFLFLFAPAALLTPLQVTRNFGGDVWRLSLIEIVYSVGMIAGGILIASWGGFKNRIYTMGLSIVLCGLLAIALGLSPNFALYLAIVAALGVSLPLWNAPSVTLLQTKVEPEFMGRVMSVFTMAASTMMPLGMVVFGPVADTISIDTLLIVTGAAVALLAIPMVGSKVLREAGKSEM